jgi:hypothetical protein
MNKKRVPSTVVIDEDVKTDFKVEVTRNHKRISDVVQQLMEGYIKVSKKMREDGETKE